MIDTQIKYNKMNNQQQRRHSIRLLHLEKNVRTGNKCIEMRMTTSTKLSALALALIIGSISLTSLSTIVSGNSFHDNNNNSHFNSNYNNRNINNNNYSIFQSQELSFDSDANAVTFDGQTETVAFFDSSSSGTINNNNDVDNESSSEGSCLDTIFFHGGHIHIEPNSQFLSFQYLDTNLNTAGNHLQNHHDDDNYYCDEQDNEEEDEDDDDEDDCDDGSCSMLSNSAIRKTILQTRGGALTAAAHTTMTNEFTKRLITAALLTLLYEGVLGHILEFLKIAMQTAPSGTTYLSVIQDITKQKGITGLWDGFIPWGVVQSVFKGGVFGLAHSVAKAQLSPLVEKGLLPKQLAMTLAGGIAGGFQGYILSPTLLLKTRVMTNPIFRENMTLLKTTLLSFTIGLDVVQKEGVVALMKGSNIFALKRVFDWSTRYYFSDLFSAMMQSAKGGVKLSPLELIVADLLGGTASTLATLPLDVIVAKSQDAKKAGQKVSAWRTFMKDYEEGGWKGLYDANMSGFEARLAHVCFTTVVMKTGTSFMYDLLYGKK